MNNTFRGRTVPKKTDLLARIELLEKENQALTNMLARAERELNNRLLPEELPPAEIPYLVACRMKYWCLPWEAFWCFEHKNWMDELDNSFPHSMADSTCHECRRSNG